MKSSKNILKEKAVVTPHHDMLPVARIGDSLPYAPLHMARVVRDLVSQEGDWLLGISKRLSIPFEFLPQSAGPRGVDGRDFLKRFLSAGDSSQQGAAAKAGTPGGSSSGVSPSLADSKPILASTLASLTFDSPRYYSAQNGASTSSSAVAGKGAIKPQDCACTQHTLRVGSSSLAGPPGKSSSPSSSTSSSSSAAKTGKHSSGATASTTNSNGRGSKSSSSSKARSSVRKMLLLEASGGERNALMEGSIVLAPPHSQRKGGGPAPSRPRALKPPMSRNPLFDALSFRRGDKAARPPLKLKSVVVKGGDTLADIAREHSMTIRDLQRMNSLFSDTIFEGDSLVVSQGPLRCEPAELRRGIRRTSRPLFSRLALELVQEDASFSSKSSAAPSFAAMAVGGPLLASASARRALAAAAGATRIARGGQSGMREGRWERKGKGFQKLHGGWMRFNAPVLDGFVSSPFGWRWGSFHEGVDLAAEQGAPVLASDHGVVTFAGWNGGYGQLVAISHEGGFTTRYAHCCVIKARVGQRVCRGQQVACVGATGRATGPHLHFEVRKNGEAVDPFKWCNL